MCSLRSLRGGTLVGKHMQAVVQITTEFTIYNHLFEITIGRRYEANIHPSRVRAAQALKLALL